MLRINFGSAKIGINLDNTNFFIIIAGAHEQGICLKKKQGGRKRRAVIPPNQAIRCVIALT
jgi:hypothetical protein